MKNFLIIAFVLLFAACEKDENAKLIETDPTITDVLWYKAYSGTNLSGGIEYQVTIPDGLEILSLKLYKTPTILINTIDKPTTKKYNHLATPGYYPTTNDSFYFVFVKKDGTLVPLQPFTGP